MGVSHPSPGTKYTVYNIKRRKSNSKSRNGRAASVGIDFSLYGASLMGERRRLGLISLYGASLCSRILYMALSSLSATTYV